jgi:hypothetical protein
MLMVLTLKGDLGGEPLATTDYDKVATALFILCVPVALIANVAYKWRRVVRDDISDKRNPKYIDLVQSAFQWLAI